MTEHDHIEEEQIIQVGEVEEIDGKVYAHMEDEPGIGFITEGVEVPEDKGFKANPFGITDLNSWNEAAVAVAGELNESDFQVAKASLTPSLFNRTMAKWRNRRIHARHIR